MAIVTGAGRGIGRAVAHALGGRGARVALLARTADEIGRVGEELRSRPGTAKTAALACDVTDARSVAAAVAGAEEALGPADILVNGAGEALSAPFVKTDDALWNRLLAVNLTGTFLVTRQVATGMIARGSGRIVNIASVAGLTGAPYIAAYAAAKHGVVGLTRALAQELARSGITVNAVCPGYVDTSMTDRSIAKIASKTGMSEPEARAVLAARSPQNRMMTVEEIAAMVVFLVTDEARGINGQSIVIDGGGLVA